MPDIVDRLATSLGFCQPAPAPSNADNHGKYEVLCRCSAVPWKVYCSTAPQLYSSTPVELWSCLGNTDHLYGQDIGLVTVGPYRWEFASKQFPSQLCSQKSVFLWPNNKIMAKILA